MSGHTKGEWTAKQDVHGFWNVMAGDQYVVGSEGIFYGKTETEDAATAHLIAAAPELLEALQMVQEAAVEERGGDFNLTTEQWAKFHAAIAKATKEPS